MIEVDEVLYRWQKGMSERSIARSLGIARMTIRKIIFQARATGLQESSDSEDIARVHLALCQMRRIKKGKSPVRESLKEYHEKISSWLEIPHMTVTQMAKLLKEENKVVSENTLRRYIQQHFPPLPKSTIHLETKPGQQGQVDFACVGLMQDPVREKLRKAYAFILTLSHSRYRFVRFVFKQDIPTWIDCHIRAFHFFGGIPLTLMPDNLKSGIDKADLYDPVVNRAYGELERHYGFVCDPTKVRTPRHKGKVERSVSLVRQQILAGRSFKDIEEANAYALQWCRYEIGLKPSRTTGQAPWEKFVQEEKETLLPLPEKDYVCPLWQGAKAHRDHHVVFEGSFYSVPNQYIGQDLWIRASERLVEIYLDTLKIKTHIRSYIRGQWVTDPQDYPKEARLFLQGDESHCLGQAREIGASTYNFLTQLFKSPALTC